MMPDDVHVWSSHDPGKSLINELKDGMGDGHRTEKGKRGGHLLWIRLGKCDMRI